MLYFSISGMRQVHMRYLLFLVSFHYKFLILFYWNISLPLCWFYIDCMRYRQLGISMLYYIIRLNTLTKFMIYLLLLNGHFEFNYSISVVALSDFSVAPDADIADILSFRCPAVSLTITSLNFSLILISRLTLPYYWLFLIYAAYASMQARGRTI
jgi:hypothetical protein